MESFSDTSFLTESRPLGMVEESWTKGICGGTGITVLAALFNRLFHGEVDHIRQAVQHLLDTHPLLRSQIVENAKSKLWIEAPDSCSSASTYVQQKTWPSVSPAAPEDYSGAIIFPNDRRDKHGSLALHKIINEELNVNFVNGDGKPNMPMRVFHVSFYPNNERRQTVIALKFNGGVLDRQSACVISQSFFTALRRSVGGGMPTVLSTKRSIADAAILPAVEDLIPEAKASKSFWQKGVQAAGYAVYAKIYSLLPFNPAYTSSRFSISAWSKKSSFESNVVSLNLGKHDTASVLDACERAGISLQSALSAAFLKTVASLKELKKKKLDEFTYMCILDCRDRLEPKLGENALGNYSLGIPQHEKVKEGIDFWEYARQIDASVKKDIAKSKHFTELPVLGFLFSYVMKHPYLTPSSSMRTALMALCTGTGKATNSTNPSSWGGGGDDELEMVGSMGPFASMHYVGPCFFVAEEVWEGPEMAVTVVYPAPVYCKAQMVDVLQRSVGLLRQASCRRKP